MLLFSKKEGLPAFFLIFLLAGPIGWFLFLTLYSHAPAQDLMVFHTAGRLALSHDWALLRDGPAFTALLNRTHAAWLASPLVLHPWVYPPPGLLLAGALGSLPFAPAYFTFMTASLVFLGAALWRWWRDVPLRPAWMLAVLLCPASAFCIGAGQLSFCIAAILLLSLSLLETRPVAAGCLLGLLLIKPQFALMVPVALLAGRHWRAIAGAAASVTALVVISVAVFGLTPWRDWLALMLGGDPAFAAWMATGRHFGQSVDTCARLLGASPSVATAAQLAAIATAASCTWLAFSRDLPKYRRGVVLLCAAVLAAPHVGNYDAILTGVAAVTVLSTQDLSALDTIFAMALWLSSLLNPPALIAMIGLPVLTALSLATPLITAFVMLRTLTRKSSLLLSYKKEVLSDTSAAGE